MISAAPAAEACLEQEEVEISVDAIITDDSLQTREKTRPQIVDEYMDLMLEGYRFPAVDVFPESDKFFLADGSHRIAAARKAGFVTFSARAHAGGRSAALLWALKSNTAHGLKLTNADKQRKVRLALAAYPGSSNNQIAEMCAVDEGTVRNSRRRVGSSDPVKRVGSDGKEYSLPNRPALAPDLHEQRIYKQVTRLTQQLDHGALEQFKVTIDQIIEARLTNCVAAHDPNVSPSTAISPGSEQK